jgi:hypothetical protein
VNSGALCRSSLEVVGSRVVPRALSHPLPLIIGAKVSSLTRITIKSDSQ